MSTNKGMGPSVIERRLDTFILAAQTLIKQGTTLMVGGKQLDASQLVATLQAMVAYFKAADVLRAQLKQSIAVRNSEEPSVLQFLDDATLAVTCLFGSSAPELSQFGIAEKKKPARLTAEQLLVRKTKANATRAARGTRGTRQREAIKGITGPVTVSVVTGSASGQAATPSPAGTSPVTPATPASPAAAGSPRGHVPTTP